MRSAPIRLRVKGPFACFTRPEMKVERVSYPVITPSAARGLLEAILYKPQFRWRVRRIAVKRPVRFLAFRRNELKSRLSPRNPVPLPILSWPMNPPCASYQKPTTTPSSV